MHSFLKFYVFLWKNKSVFFFFMAIIPLISYLYLNNSRNKLESVVRVENYDLSKLKSNYANYNAKIVIKDGFIKTSLMSDDYKQARKTLHALNNEILADISYSILTELKEDLNSRALKISSLLDKKQALESIKDKERSSAEEQIYKDEIKVIDDLYKQELMEYQKADLEYKSYSFDQHVEILYNNLRDQKIGLKFILSFILAFFFAVLVSIIRTYLNNSFDDELEIKKETQIKSLEGLPKFKKLDIVNNKVVSGKLKISALTEVSRIFKYISARDRKVFEVVSSVKNEGNTSFTHALAEHASLNNKVLLIDMNLKNMELSVKLTKSIVKWDIADKDFAKLDQKVVQLNPNLDFLPALEDQKSLELLKTSQGLKDLIKHLKTKYDYIFIDTTAVFSVNIHNIDPIILSGVVDGVLVNYLANRTAKHTLLETVDKLRMVDCNILGIVTNNRYNPKLKNELLNFCLYLEKINTTLADGLRVKILKSYLLDEE